VIVAACKAHLGDPSAPLDAAIDGPPVGDATPLVWSAPVPVSGASDPTFDTDNETLNSSMTEMYFTIVDTTITGTPKQMWFMTRATANDAWGTPSRLDVVNTPVQTESPRLSSDDLTLYFGRNGDIYTATRTAVGAAWESPTALASVNTAAYEKWMAVCDGGYFLLSRNNGTNGQDLYEGKLGDVGTPATELNSTASEISTFLSADCLTTYFASDRNGTTQIYTATRATAASPWSTPTLVSDFGTASTNKDLWMSRDKSTAYFATIRDGRTLRAVYLSTR
jgi:hypothetical protein